MIDINSFRFNQSLKVGVACVLSTIIYIGLNVPMGMFAVTCTYILLTNYHNESLYRGIQRLSGAIFYAFLGVLTVRWFYDLPMLYYLCMTLVLLICFYFLSLKRAPYAMLLGGITYAFVTYTGMTQPLHVVDLAIGWVVATAIAVLLIVVLHWVWPIRKRKQLNQSIADVVSESLPLIRDRSKLQQKLTAFYPIQRRIDQLQVELTKRCGEHAQANYLELILLLKRLLRASAEYQAALRVYRSIDPVLHQLLDSAVPLMQNSLLSICLSFSKSTIDRYTVYQMQRLDEQIINRLMYLRRYKMLKKHDSHDVTRALVLIENVSRVKDRLLRLNDLVITLISSSTVDSKKITMPNVMPPKPISWNWEALKNSIKITVAVMIVVWFSVYFQLPNAIQALITTVVLCAEINIGRAHYKMSRRFMGVIIGGTFSLLSLFVLSHFTHFGFLLLLVFISMASAAYVAMGPERFSYAGLQSGVMIPLVLLYNSGPSPDLTLGLERLGGVVEGAIIAFIVLYSLWPAHPKKQFLSAMQVSLKYCQDFLSALIAGDEHIARQSPAKIEQGSHQVLVDAQYLLFSTNPWAQVSSGLIDELNQYALYSANLLNHMTSLPDDLNRAVVRLASPSLRQAKSVLVDLSDCAKNVEDSCRNHGKHLSLRWERQMRLMRHLGFSQRLTDKQLSTVTACLYNVQMLLVAVEKIQISVQHLYKESSATSSREAMDVQTV